MRVRAGVATRGADGEPWQVGFPGYVVAIAQRIAGEVLVAQGEQGAAVLVFEKRHRDPGAARGHGTGAARSRFLVLGPRSRLVVGEAPAENDQVRTDDLEELPGVLKPVGHADAVYAPWHRVKLGLAAHPLHVPGRVGEVTEDVV